MSPQSISSSMEAQNGSNSSNYQSENSYPNSYNLYSSARTTAQSRYPGGEPPAYNPGSQRFDTVYRTQDSASAESQTYERSTDGYDHQSNNQDYYLPSESCYLTEAPNYEHVLTVEDDQSEASQPAPAHNQRPDQFHGNSCGQTSQYVTNGHTRQYSQTTQSWVGQQTSEEMLRLGLPRDSQQRAREYEQARREYEQSSNYQQYDSSARRG